MTKLIDPLMSLDARGRIGTLISFTRRGRHTIAEGIPIPEDPKTLAQLSWRHMYQKAVALWHALTASEKQDWESLARRHHMTGYAYFLSQALKPNPGLYLPLQGGKMAGDIDMATNRILNLPLPLLDPEAATKEYVDAYASFLGLTDTPADYTGEALKVARVNAAEDALEFAAITGGYTEGARVYHSANQACASGASVQLAFNSEKYDTDGIHDNVVNNSRLTCKTAGVYLITATIRWTFNVNGVRSIRLRRSAAEHIALDTQDAPASGVHGQTRSSIFYLAVGHYMEVQVMQTSGIVLDVTRSPSYSAEFAMQRIG